MQISQSSLSQTEMPTFQEEHNLMNIVKQTCQHWRFPRSHWKECTGIFSLSLFLLLYFFIYTEIQCFSRGKKICDIKHSYFSDFFHFRFFSLKLAILIIIELICTHVYKCLWIVWSFSNSKRCFLWSTNTILYNNIKCRKKRKTNKQWIVVALYSGLADLKQKNIWKVKEKKSLLFFSTNSENHVNDLMQNACMYSAILIVIGETFSTEQ